MSTSTPLATSTSDVHEAPADEGVVATFTRNVSPIRLDFQWQDLTSAEGRITERGWSQTTIPTVLSHLPEYTQINEQLQRILLWSQWRIDEWPELAALDVDNDPIDAFDVDSSATIEGEAHAEVASSSMKADGSEASTWSSRSKKRKAYPLFARLKRIRQDIAIKRALSQAKREAVAASAAERLAAAREAWEREAAASKAVMALKRAHSRANGEAIAASATVSEVLVAPDGECISCFDEFSTAELVHLTCSHNYCKACLKEVVLNTMKVESAFPPKCCLTEIPLKTVLVCLDNKQREEYKDKTEEYSIPAGHRWYCPEPHCSKWIKPSKLHRQRRSQQTCPSCKAQICSVCRSLAHGSNQQCPEDFGLAETLEIAEAEGWRRCYNCRTMVELTTGCRHITCKCGAQFCYVCNSKWRTCNCSESDKDRRLQELRARREDRERQQREVEQRRHNADAAAEAEAEEVAEAIRQIEEMERADAFQRAEEERQRQVEEELALALLEEERIMQEIARREAEEEAGRQLRQVLLTSSREECNAMMDTLMQLINFQRAALESTHIKAEQTCLHDKKLDETKIIEESEQMSLWLNENINKRAAVLDGVQKQENDTLQQQLEEEEDEMFMQTTLYLRDKPNREQREKKMRENMQKQQLEKQAALQAKHDTERRNFQMGSSYELEGLRKAERIKLEPVEMQFQSALRRLGNQIGRERKWLEIVSTRRIALMKEHERLVLEQLEAGNDPVGLTEGEARSIEPQLPSINGPELEAPGADYGNRTTPVQRAHVGMLETETDDLYGSSNLKIPENIAELPAGESQHVTTSALIAPDSVAQFSRSGTTKRFMPGACPQSEAGSSRHSSSRASRPQDSEARRESTRSTYNPLSMSGMMTMSFTVQGEDNVSAQQNITAPPLSINQASTTSPSSTSTLSASRNSSATTDSELLDVISASKVASSGSSGAGSKSKRASIFGSILGKKREMSEEEIKRRMSGVAGDGRGYGV